MLQRQILLLALLLATSGATAAVGFFDPIWETRGTASGELFGTTVASAGDVNGDGYGDLIVGAPAIATPTVLLFYGGPDGFATTPGWQASGVNNSDFGESVAGAGDVNGDGFDDLLIGAPDEATKGRVHLFFGGAMGPGATADWTFSSTTLNLDLGQAVAGAGDTNGDGFDDIIFSDPAFDHFTGRIYIVLGRSGALPIFADAFLDGPATSARFGSSLAPAGDTNGDGLDDIIVGAPSLTVTELSQGAAYVYRGSVGPGGLTLADRWDFVGEIESGQFGWDVGGGGDVDGDGFDDIIVSAPWYNWASGFAGRVYVFHGAATGISTTPDWISDGPQAGTTYGRSVAILGDLTGDGRNDVIIGDPGYAGGWGRVEIYNGNANGLFMLPQFWFNSPSAEGNFGWDVARVGSLDGSDLSQFVVGAPESSYLETNEGAAFAYRSNCCDLDLDGFANCFNDCDDTSADVYPDAPELNDGMDNQCDGDDGAGLVDELETSAGYSDPANRDVFGWPTQPGADAYEATRAPVPSFSSGCTTIATTGTSWNDPTLPLPGTALFYLARASSPNPGSWGAGSDGQARFPCP